MKYAKKRTVAFLFLPRVQSDTFASALQGGQRDERESYKKVVTVTAVYSLFQLFVLGTKWIFVMLKDLSCTWVSTWVFCCRCEQNKSAFDCSQRGANYYFLKLELFAYRLQTNKKPDRNSFDESINKELEHVFPARNRDQNPYRWQQLNKKQRTHNKLKAKCVTKQRHRGSEKEWTKKRIFKNEYHHTVV